MHSPQECCWTVFLINSLTFEDMGGFGGMLPRNFFEILNANGAFWINLEHRLRAFLVSVLHKVSTCHAFTSRVLELLNCVVFLIINSFIWSMGGGGVRGFAPRLNFYFFYCKWCILQLTPENVLDCFCIVAEIRRSYWKKGGGSGPLDPPPPPPISALEVMSDLTSVFGQYIYMYNF